MSKENVTISKVLLSVERYKGCFGIFKEGILRNDYTSKKNYFSRVLLWKTCLMTETLNMKNWRSKLIPCRAIYHKLKQKWNPAIPWDTLDPENEFFVALSSFEASPKLSDPSSNNTIIHTSHSFTISSQSGSSSRKISKDTNLLNMIILDVHRLFPGDLLFHGNNKTSFKHKRQVIRLLFIWSKCNPQVGYKQGIHEVLGLIYKNLLQESLEISFAQNYSLSDLEILALYDRNYFEHDLYFLFNKFLVSSGVTALFYQTEDSLINSIEHFNELLMKVDQKIHFNLITRLRLDTKLWVIRYFRLLLLRELGNDLEGPSILWDKVVAMEASAPNPPNLQYIPDIIKFLVIVLLIHVKAELSFCDFGEAFLLLLHYPISTLLNIYPDFLQNIFDDAYHLSRLGNDDKGLYEYGLKLNKKYVNIRMTRKRPLDNVDFSSQSGRLTTRNVHQYHL